MSRFTAFLVIVVAAVGLQLNTCAFNAYAMDAGITSCQTECLKCANLCNTTMQHCHKLGGKHMTADHMNALQDCASLCRQSAGFIARGSQLSSKLCTLCAESCIKCAESCETYKTDKAMQACAQQCRACAKDCQKMAG